MTTEQKLKPDFVPVPYPDIVPNGTRKSKFRVLVQLLLVAGIAGSLAVVFSGRKWLHNKIAHKPMVSEPLKLEESCTQADPMYPSRHAHLWKNLTSVYQSDAFKKRAIRQLGSAVTFETISWDDMGDVGVDPRWDVYEDFQEHLAYAFPLVHSTLKLTKVNQYGLVYEWKGSSRTARPILLAAHQDVVPVEESAIEEWEHPPFSGYFDGTKIWGRGSTDDKAPLISILTTIESLISHGFNPRRTIVFASGFDEEISGPRGAAHIAQALEKRYGKDGFAFIIDEGGVFGTQYGTTFAVPGVAEKGYLNAQIELTAPGGHSSIPPDHTSIGMLAAMLVNYEDNPFNVSLSRKHPIYTTLQCLGEYAADLPDALRNLITQSVTSDVALNKLTEEVSKISLIKSLIGTTQAIDIIEGGIKVNALPEQASAIVNHRIAVFSSLEETRKRDTNLLVPLAQKFNLTFEAFGKTVIGDNGSSAGNLTLRAAFHDGIEPAPITSTTGPIFELLSGTIKATYNSHRNLGSADSIIVAPGMVTGNTDTRHYWNLSSSIFRYNHLHIADAGLNGIHTVNEFIPVDSYLEMIEFFTILILNSDESTQL
ncbi:hypothetical protein NP233_g6692 [Leucocoprinus birnbaumii]|uniref:Peptidase M20 dimerisation domain-containing protein n=1 Tax=Leucocoprinus birnbaumii TaxID=56174 RepID=A0AAD5YVI7_9AGAR|nr:hypothetical protein NP233_g6692 [Leucocoprinus birnbaumii]